MELFDCKDKGECKEYVGTKVNKDKKGYSFRQPVKLKRLEDEFGYGDYKGKYPNTPAVPHMVLANDVADDVPASAKDGGKFASSTVHILTTFGLRNYKRLTDPSPFDIW